jgi:hypothetical protein
MYLYLSLLGNESVSLTLFFFLQKMDVTATSSASSSSSSSSASASFISAMIDLKQITDKQRPSPAAIAQKEEQELKQKQLWYQQDIPKMKPMHRESLVFPNGTGTAYWFPQMPPPEKEDPKTLRPLYLLPQNKDKLAMVDPKILWSTHPTELRFLMAQLLVLPSGKKIWLWIEDLYCQQITVDVAIKEAHWAAFTKLSKEQVADGRVDFDMGLHSIDYSQYFTARLSCNGVVKITMCHDDPNKQPGPWSGLTISMKLPDEICPWI